MAGKKGGKVRMVAASEGWQRKWHQKDAAEEGGKVEGSRRVVA